MNPFVLIIEDQEIEYLHETDYIGQSMNSKDLNTYLLKLSGGTYNISLSTLRFYQNIGLVKKPVREGRIAKYRFETLYDLLAVRTFRAYFNLTIAEMLEIVEHSDHLHSVAFVLQQIELAYLVRYGTTTSQQLRERLRNHSEGDDPNTPARPPVTIGEVRSILRDLEYLPVFTALAREDAIPKLRTDFFNLILKGVNPLNIKIEF